MAVVVAADGLRGARAATTNAHDGDRGAGHSDQNVHILDDNSEGFK